MDSTKIRVLMMPDYREGNPYQQLLAEAIAKTGIGVLFPYGYRRGLPIFRALREQVPAVQVLHLHWLEPYLRGKNPLSQIIYGLKFLIDIYLTRLSGVRLVWTIHNQIEHDNPFPQLERWIRQLVLNLSDRIIVHHQLALDGLRQDYQIDVNKVDIIPHGHYRTVYASAIDQRQAREQLSLPVTGKIYLYFGVLRPYKGLEYLLEVWQRNQDILEDCQLVIAGFAYDSLYLQELQAKIDQTPNIVFYPEFIKDEQIPVFFSAVDFLVFPYRQILTSGSVILAMSYGKPVTAPRLGAIPETVAEADGLLYDAANPQGLDLAIQRSLTCSLSELQALTVEACDRLDWEPIGQQTALAFRQSLADLTEHQIGT